MIKFSRYAAETLLQPIRVLQKTCIRLIGGIGKFDHCAPTAKNLNILVV